MHSELGLQSAAGLGAPFPRGKGGVRLAPPAPTPTGTPRPRGARRGPPPCPHLVRQAVAARTTAVTARTRPPRRQLSRPRRKRGCACAPWWAGPARRWALPRAVGGGGQNQQVPAPGGEARGTRGARVRGFVAARPAVSKWRGLGTPCPAAAWSLRAVQEGVVRADPGGARPREASVHSAPTRAGAGSNTSPLRAP